MNARYEGELANDLGNLVSRATAMVVRYRDGVVPAGDNVLDPVHERVGERLAAVDLTGALEEIWTLVRAANRFVEERKPWELAKQRREASQAGWTRRSTRWPTRCAGWASCCTRTSRPPAEAMLEAVGDPDAVAGTAPLGLLAAGASGAAAGADLPRARCGMIDTHAHLDSCEGPVEA